MITTTSPAATDSDTPRSTASLPKCLCSSVISTIACAICGSIIFVTLLNAEWWQGVLFGLATVCTATLGDLGESMIKRDLGIKDMGKLLPGHGGLMDRLDSLLPTAPVAWLLLAAFVS